MIVDEEFGHYFPDLFAEGKPEYGTLWSVAIDFDIGEQRIDGAFFSLEDRVARLWPDLDPENSKPIAELSHTRIVAADYYGIALVGKHRF